MIQYIHKRKKKETKYFSANYNNTSVNTEGLMWGGKKRGAFPTHHLGLKHRKRKIKIKVQSDGWDVCKQLLGEFDHKKGLNHCFVFFQSPLSVRLSLCSSSFLPWLSVCTLTGSQRSQSFRESGSRYFLWICDDCFPFASTGVSSHSRRELPARSRGRRPRGSQWPWLMLVVRGANGGVGMRVEEKVVCVCVCLMEKGGPIQCEGLIWLKKRREFKKIKAIKGK